MAYFKGASQEENTTEEKSKECQYTFPAVNVHAAVSPKL